MGHAEGPPANGAPPVEGKIHRSRANRWEPQDDQPLPGPPGPPPQREGAVLAHAPYCSRWQHRHLLGKPHRSRQCCKRLIMMVLAVPRGHRGPGCCFADRDWNHQSKEEAFPQEDKPPPEANFALSGKLAEESNTVNGVVLLHTEPPEARRPIVRWRLYTFKNGEMRIKPQTASKPSTSACLPAYGGMYRMR